MHVAEQDLELYVMGRLPEDQTAAIAEHTLECEACAELLADARRFVQQMRGLTQEMPAGERQIERRRSPRIPTSDPGRLRVLHPAAVESEEVLILDTSRDGLKLAVSRLLEPGTLVQIRLRDFIVLAEVRHCNSSGETYHAGVRIEDIFPISR